MRSLLPLAIVAAWVAGCVAGCGGSSKSKADMSIPPDMATLSCQQTVDTYCAANPGCVRNATDAQNLAGYCADGGMAISSQSLGCSGTDIEVIVQYSDDSTVFFYSGGTLTAIYTSVPHSQELVCLAGPANVVPPQGCGTPLDLCSH
ncbi:MAG TPA: hypothetical protein VGL86_23950 [Polyangia bacterium]|jgi:hypothetical protein